jgi:hypothetical protein
MANYTPQQLEKLAVVLYQQAQLMKAAEGEGAVSNNQDNKPADSAGSSPPDASLGWFGLSDLQNLFSEAGSWALSNLTSAKDWALSNLTSAKDWASSNLTAAKDWAVDNPAKASLAVLAALAALGGLGYGGYRLLRSGKSKRKSSK